MRQEMPKEWFRRRRARTEGSSFRHSLVTPEHAERTGGAAADGPGRRFFIQKERFQETHGGSQEAGSPIRVHSCSDVITRTVPDWERVTIDWVKARGPR